MHVDSYKSNIPVWRGPCLSYSHQWIPSRKTIYLRHDHLFNTMVTYLANKRDIVSRINFFFFFWEGIFFFLFVQYSALLHLAPLRFHCTHGCWDRTQDRCNLCIGSQTL
jgi:hypothetical protein